MKSPLRWSLLVLALGLWARGASGPVRPPEKPPFAHAPLAVSNGCFVESVILLDRWRETQGAEAWSRLLQWGAREDDEVVAGHAVAIGEVRGALWCWDVNFGWSRLPLEAAQRDDPAAALAPVLAKYPRLAARYPTYRYDFPQAPAASPPAAQPAAASAAVREATLVGAQLAKRRPVNVVAFSYGPAEQKQESAAVVFLFHGRYCIYVPELGTVPFRVRGGIENQRLIQELLRRALPGVGALKKL